MRSPIGHRTPTVRPVPGICDATICTSFDLAIGGAVLHVPGASTAPGTCTPPPQTNAASIDDRIPSRSSVCGDACWSKRSSEATDAPGYRAANCGTLRRMARPLSPFLGRKWPEKSHWQWGVPPLRKWHADRDLRGRRGSKIRSDRRGSVRIWASGVEVEVLSARKRHHHLLLEDGRTEAASRPKMPRPHRRGGAHPPHSRRSCSRGGRLSSPRRHRPQVIPTSMSSQDRSTERSETWCTIRLLEVVSVFLSTGSVRPQ